MPRSSYRKRPSVTTQPNTPAAVSVGPASVLLRSRKTPPPRREAEARAAARGSRRSRRGSCTPPDRGGLQRRPSAGGWAAAAAKCPLFIPERPLTCSERVPVPRTRSVVHLLLGRRHNHETREAGAPEEPLDHRVARVSSSSRVTATSPCNHCPSRSLHLRPSLLRRDVHGSPRRCQRLPSAYLLESGGRCCSDHPEAHEAGPDTRRDARISGPWNALLVPRRGGAPEPCRWRSTSSSTTRFSARSGFWHASAPAPGGSRPILRSIMCQSHTGSNGAFLDLKMWIG